ncbi:MAG TPA: hypothetical protein VM123_10555 [archaeon]|nr:hypothetical protein [archaeon]
MSQDDEYPFLCSECNSEKLPGCDKFAIKCPKCGEYEVSGTFAAMLERNNEIINNKPIYSLMVRRHWEFEKEPYFLHTGSHEQLLRSYKAIAEEKKIISLPLFLFRNKGMGEYLTLSENLRWITASLNSEEFFFIVDQCIKNGWMEKSSDEGKIRLTFEGRDYVKKLMRRKKGDSNNKPRIGYI